MFFSHRFFKLIRLSHLYLGVFAAPAVLFFALTGALQTFSLHETTRGSSYTPPAWSVSAAKLHKKQTIVVPVRRAPPEQAATQTKLANALAPAPAQSRDSSFAPSVPAKNLLPMKIFFVPISLSLLLSTLTGIYIGYRCSRSPERYSRCCRSMF